MRKIFADFVEKEMEKNKDIYFLTADLGYTVLDKIWERFPKNFYNVGASEQLMIGAAAGLAMGGKIPICYSITSFLLRRPFEFIQHFVRDNIPIKLVGVGKNKEYEKEGPTHWCEEWKDILKCFGNNLEVYEPINDNDVETETLEFLYNMRPSFLYLSKNKT